MQMRRRLSDANMKEAEKTRELSLYQEELERLRQGWDKSSKELDEYKTALATKEFIITQLQEEVKLLQSTSSSTRLSLARTSDPTKTIDKKRLEAYQKDLNECHNKLNSMHLIYQQQLQTIEELNNATMAALREEHEYDLEQARIDCDVRVQHEVDKVRAENELGLQQACKHEGSLNMMTHTEYYRPASFQTPHVEPILKNIPLYLRQFKAQDDKLIQSVADPSTQNVTIGRKLGAGSFGSVTLLCHVGDCSRVAKVFKPHPRDSGTDYILSMCHELEMHQFALKIDPTITPRVYNAFAFHNRFACIIYEYFGQSLYQIRNTRDLNDSDYDLIHHAVLQKFYKAFSNGLYHLDLSRSNILFERSAEGQLTVKLADWGLALFKTESGQFWNTEEPLLRNALAAELDKPYPYSQSIRGDQYTKLNEYHRRLASVFHNNDLEHFIKLLCLCSFVRRYVIEPGWRLQSRLLNEFVGSEFDDEFKDMLRQAHELETAYGQPAHSSGYRVALGVIMDMTFGIERATQLFVIT